MKSFVVAVLLLVSNSAFAVKHVGGGGGADETLLDRILYSSGNRLDQAALYELVKERFETEFRRFPTLRILSFHVLIDAKKKLWMLEERELPSECRNVPSVAIPFEAWACQDHTSVRISAKVWSSISLDAKADLVFHEIMTAGALINPKMESTFSYVAPALAVLTSAQLDEEVQREWYRLEFGYLPNATQWSTAVGLAKQFAAKVCAFPDEMSRLNFSAASAVELGFLKLDASIQLMVSKAYLELLDGANRGGACLVPEMSGEVALQNEWLAEFYGR